MAYEFKDYLGEVKDLVKDTSPKLEEPKDYHAALRSSARWYSQKEAREVVEDLTSDGTGDFALPAKWEDRFSVVVSIEYPISTAGNKAVYLSDVDYAVVRTPSALKLRLFKSIPSGEKIRVTHTARHVLSESEITLPDSAFECVTEYAAGCCFDKLAAAFTPTTEDNPQGDFSAFRSLSDKYRSQAKEKKSSAEAKLPTWLFV